MRAMILAAGFGTRLRPLTDKTPKALIPVAGKPLLAHVLQRLQHAGFDEIAINGHHLADQLVEFLATYAAETLKIHLSIEAEILETGGGIKKMIPLLGSDAPILVHNVDVFSDLPLERLYEAHLRHGNRATLALQSRPTRRYLLFDESHLLCGRMAADARRCEWVRQPRGKPLPWAFNGIQVIDPLLFGNYPADKFSSIDAYLRAAGRGERIMGHQMDDCYWRDVGKWTDLQEIESDLSQRNIRFL